jgi:hypothetical protein
MQNPHALSDSDLLARMPELVRAERAAMADVVIHLIEIDLRRLYLEQACSSLYSYCKDRLGYSEDEALKRVRVAHLCERVPQALEELKSGQIHLTGLFVLSPHVTAENAETLLVGARGKSRREIEELVASVFPQPDVPDRIEAVPERERLVIAEAKALDAVTEQQRGRIARRVAGLPQPRSTSRNRARDLAQLV